MNDFLCNMSGNTFFLVLLSMCGSIIFFILKIKSKLVSSFLAFIILIHSSNTKNDLSKMFGKQNLSKLHNSSISFCSGVPVSKMRSSTIKPSIRFDNLHLLFLSRWASSITQTWNLCLLNSIASFIYTW
eukprot:NODE_907_length_3188_cov_0.123988.p3 type:complete len:129 gc:universal NODE_907_length_3188_cov_0.123988:1496-1110(-)